MKLGFAFCGSFCTLSKAIAAYEQMKRSGYDVIPILSESVVTTDTRFGTAKEILERITAVGGDKPITTVKEAEKLGPSSPLDILVIAPCTGNTLARLANGITDTAVTMAAKAHLRSDRPLVLALASNDALSGNLANIAKCAVRKNVYFVPLGQDDHSHKPHSLVADYSKIRDTVLAAMSGIQLQPVLLK